LVSADAVNKIEKKTIELQNYKLMFSCSEKLNSKTNFENKKTYILSLFFSIVYNVHNFATCTV